MDNERQKIVLELLGVSLGTGVLKVGTTDAVSLLLWSLSCAWRKFHSISDFSPQDASRTSSPTVTTQNTPRQCQMSSCENH
jgi:hypothetical protein